MAFDRGKLVCFIGIDGSGKSTVAKAFMKDFVDDEICYVWGAYEMRWLKPIVKMGRRLILGGRGVEKDFSDYLGKVRSVNKMNPVFFKLYRILVFTEYLVELFFRVRVPLMRGTMVVCDRYIYDTAAAFAANLEYSDVELKKFADKLLAFSSRPDVVFWVDVPESVSMGRKDDIPHVEYLTIRRNIYKKLAEMYPIIILDGTQAVDVITNTVKNHLYKI